MAQRRPCYHSHLLRAIANARGNIPQHLSTARQRLTGGTGIATENTGETFSFDDIGKLLASIYGIQYGALFRDEASRCSSLRAGVKERPGECYKEVLPVRGGVWQGTCSLRKM
jgi:hypothetical protein